MQCGGVDKAKSKRGRYNTNPSVKAGHIRRGVQYEISLEIRKFVGLYEPHAINLSPLGDRGE